MVPEKAGLCSATSVCGLWKIQGKEAPRGQRLMLIYDLIRFHPSCKIYSRSIRFWIDLSSLHSHFIKLVHIPGNSELQRSSGEKRKEKVMNVY